MEVPSAGETLRDLAESLLARFAEDDSQQSRPRLLVGRMPPGLPTPIPVPAGATLFGSLVAEQGGHTTIVLETPAAPEEVRRFYREHLLGAGWQDTRMGPAAANGAAPPEWDEYLWDDAGPRLSIHAGALAGGGSGVWIYVHTAADQTPRGHRRADRLFELPQILSTQQALPPGGHYASDGGGSGFGRTARSRLVLEADGDLDAISAHYRTYLEGRGWRMLGAGQDGALAWSTWAVPDPEDPQPWYAHLVIVRLGWVEARYLLDLEVIWPEEWRLPAWLAAVWPDPSTAASVDEGQEEHGAAEDQDPLRGLLARLLLGAVDEAGRERLPALWAELEILPGETVAEVARVVPLPPGGRVVGGIRLGNGRGTAVIRAGQPPRALQAYYRRCLADSGWEEQPVRNPLEGRYSFVQSIALPMRFVKQDRALVASVSVGAGEGGLSEARISVGPLREQPENGVDPPQLGRLRPQAPTLLPRLIAPEGGRQQAAGEGGEQRSSRAGSATERASARATLEAPGIDLGMVAAHYHGQLAAAGWSLEATGTDGAVCWSTWSVPDAESERGPGAGRFLVVCSPFGDGRYTLDMQLKRAARPRHEPGVYGVWRSGPTLP